MIVTCDFCGASRKETPWPDGWKTLVRNHPMSSEDNHIMQTRVVCDLCVSWLLDLIVWDVAPRIKKEKKDGKVQAG